MRNTKKVRKYRLRRITKRRRSRVKRRRSITRRRRRSRRKHRRRRRHRGRHLRGGSGTPTSTLTAATAATAADTARECDKIQKEKGRKCGSGKPGKSCRYRFNKKLKKLGCGGATATATATKERRAKMITQTAPANQSATVVQQKKDHLIQTVRRDRERLCKCLGADSNKQDKIDCVVSYLKQKAKNCGGK